MLKTKKFWYILLFSILYLVVAGSSFFHAIAFFGLANNLVMSIILAFAFEVGQAAVLFSLLTSEKDRSRIMPWVLMCMFTLVQVVGNIYSSYKYIMLNSVENLKYFKEPIFIWTTLPDEQATVIITYVVGAILPIASLLLTSMITNYLSDQEEEKKKLESLDIGEEVGEEIEDDELPEENLNPIINQNSILQMENAGLQESNKKKDEEIAKIRQELEELKQSKENTNETEKDEETLRDDGSNDSLQQEDEDVEQAGSAKSENDDENSIEHIEELNGQESDTGITEQQDKSNNEGEQSLETETTNTDYTNTENDKTPSETNKQIDERIPEEQKRESHFINL